jgi:VanZ family protein
VRRTDKPVTPSVDRLISARVARTAAAAYAVVLTYLLLAPYPLEFLGVSGRAVERTIDQIITACLQHGLAYMVLAWLLMWACRSRHAVWQAACLVFAVGHGLSTEWLQHFIPHRYCEWPDGLANAVGVGLGWLGALLLFRMASHQSEKASESPIATLMSPIGQIDAFGLPEKLPTDSARLVLKQQVMHWLLSHSVTADCRTAGSTDSLVMCRFDLACRGLPASSSMIRTPCSRDITPYGPR